jgi:N utilization substance protein B
MIADKDMREKTDDTRIAAVQCVYAVLFMGEKLSQKTMRYFMRRSFASDAAADAGDRSGINAKLFAYLVRGIIKEREALDAAIAENLRLDIARTDPLLVCVMRAGAFEIMRRGNVPPAVAVSEYTGIAARFFDSKKTALANAVLDKIAKG